MLKTKKDFEKVIEKNDKPTNNTYKLTSNQRYEKPHTEKNNPIMQVRSFMTNQWTLLQPEAS